MLGAIKKYLRKNYETLIVVFGILVLLNLIFFPIIFQNKTLMPAKHTMGMTVGGPYGTGEKTFFPSFYADSGAPAWQSIPLFELVLKQYRQGQWPLWNPYSGLGAPLAANMQSAAFHLPQLLFAGFGKLNMHWDAYFLFRIFLAILFTYFLARKIGLGQLGAGVAGIIFGLNAFFISFLTNVNLNVDMFLPLLLLLIEIYIKNPSQSRFLLFIFAVFLSITAGMPESTFFAILATFCYGVFRIIQFNRFSNFKKILSLSAKQVMLPILFGFGLAAFLLLPFLEYIQVSSNAHAVADQVGLRTRFILLTSWVTLFLSLMSFGRKNLSSPENENLGKYFSITILLWMVVIFYYAKSAGFPIFNLIGYVPIFNLAFFPIFMAPTAILAMAILAGIGAEKINFRSLVFATPILVIVCFFNVKWSITLPIVIILSILIAIISRQAKTQPKFDYRKIMLLSFVLIIQIAMILPPSYPDRSDPFMPSPSATYLKKQAKQTPARIFSNDYVFIPNTITPLEIADLRFSDALHPKLFSNVVHKIANIHEMANFFGDRIPLNHHLLKILGVGFLVQSYPIPSYYIDHDELLKLVKSRKNYKIDYSLIIGPNSSTKKSTESINNSQLVFRDETADVYKLNQAMPRARVYYDYVIESNHDQAVQALLSDSRNWEQQVILSQAPSPGIAPIKNKPVLKAEIIDYKPQNIKIKANSPEAGILAISEIFYPGWQATIDGQKTKILQANVTERAIVLPPGEHEVEFLYNPNSYKYGLFISIVSLLALLFILYSTKNNKQISKSPVSC